MPVKQQIGIAAGISLPFGQDDIQRRGFAMELRINAEDPKNDFLPSFGRITRYFAPGGPGVRTDAAIYTGYHIPPYYDSMIAKLICYGNNRGEAILRMRRALHEYHIMGVTTSIPFHAHMMENVPFMGGNFDTNFVENEFNMRDRGAPDEMEAAVIATILAHRQGEVLAQFVAPGTRDTSNWKWLSRWERLKR